eukprot:scaffold26255_cov106-Cyclotella_meneghiniana.AAC.4
MANPSFLGRQQYSDLQCILKDFQLAVINGDKWDKPERPLWLLRNSHPADNPSQIEADYAKRASAELGIEIEEDLFTVEWHECRARSTQPTELISTSGWCIVSDILREDKIDRIMGKLKPTANARVTKDCYPVRHHTSSKYGDSETTIAASIIPQRQYIDQCIHFCIKDVPARILDEIPENSCMLNISEGVTTKTIRDLLLGIKKNMAYSKVEPLPIKKIGTGGQSNCIYFVGDESMKDNLLAVAPLVLSKLNIWTGKTTATLDTEGMVSNNMKYQQEQEAQAVARAQLLALSTPPSTTVTQAPPAPTTTTIPAPIVHQAPLAPRIDPVVKKAPPPDLGKPSKVITMLQDILSRMDTFSLELGNLKQDVTDLKATRGSTTPITIEPSVTSSVSELSVYMDTISTQIEKLKDV